MQARPAAHARGEPAATPPPPQGRPPPADPGGQALPTSPTAGRPRLSWGQRVLVAVLGVLIVAVQLMIVQAYRDLGSTIRSLDTATEVLTDLHNAHREAFTLALAVDQPRRGDWLERVQLRRGFLGGSSRRLRRPPPATPGCGRISPGSPPSWPHSTPPSPALGPTRPPRLARAHPALQRRATAVEALLKPAYGHGETQFLGALQQTLQSRRSFQRLLIGTGGLTLAVALVLALSLRRRASRAFAAAYALVVGEVNERKLAEQALRQSEQALRESEQALRESEQRFRALVHQASDVFTVIDSGGRILYQSPAVEPVLGYSADELLGTGIDALVDPDNLAAFRELLARSLPRPSASVVGELSLRPHAAPRTSRRFEMTITNLLHDPTVRGLVLNYRDITERVLHREELTRQAFLDPLTDLPNRARLAERLDSALGRRDAEVGLLFVDLDDFKQVNDTLGHDAGDELLRQVGSRFGGCLREGDTLARMGGDEFIVLVPDATKDVAMLVARRLEASLTKPFTLAKGMVTVRASIGVATGAAGRSTPDTLLREADAAMYRAKAIAKVATGR